MKVFSILAIALLSLLSSRVHGHTSAASFIDLKVADDEIVEAAFDFDLRDLNELLQIDSNLDGALTWGEITAASKAIEELVIEKTRLRGSSECVPENYEPIALAEHGDGPFVRLTIRYRCPLQGAVLNVDHSAWFDFDPGQRALLEFTDVHGADSQTLLSRSAPRWQAAETSSARLMRFFIEGAHHLITGYDHLAFLGVLLLALARRRSLEPIAPLAQMMTRAAGVITAFTIAHSLTLALAATGIVILPSKPVEVAIAASVLIAAILNLWRSAGSHGFKLAFAFGLVHGLGFAGALVEMTADRIDLLALGAFNLGIEAAQIAIAIVAVPIAWNLFKNARSERIGLPAASVAVAVLAGFWMYSRLGF